MFSLFSRWNERRKRDKWLINEFPHLALVQFETLCDLNGSDTPKEGLYKTLIEGYALTFGVSNENRDEYAKHIGSCKDCVLMKMPNPRGDCLRTKQSHILFT